MYLNMESITSCSLCGFTCCEFKCLYEESGEISEVYQVAVKYFSPSLLDGETKSSTLRVICIECWQHIIDFHSFQQWIFNAQAQQENFKFIINEEQPDLVEDKDDMVFSVFKCAKCAEVFKSYDALDEHFKIFHPVKRENKNKGTSTKLRAMKQKDGKQILDKPRKKSVENSYKCETCGASFTLYGNLRRHMRRKHEVQPLLKWICKYCNKMFRKQSNLEKHKKLHEEKIDDDEENNKMDCELVEDDICKRNKILNHNENESGFEQINLEKSKDRNGEQNFKQKCYNTRFSRKEVSDLSTESQSAETNSEMQMNMPTLDIVDIKEEISTDEETDQYSNKLQNNSPDELSSDTEEECYNFLSKWKGYFECPKCNQHEKIKKYSVLSEHFALKHPDESCYVTCCRLTLNDQRSIEEHIQFHENPNAFECRDCSKRFKNKRGLNSHKLQVHSNKRSSYHLHFCYCKRGKNLYANGENMEYDSVACCPRKKKILEDDALIAKWKNELICEICKATFAYYSLMRAHFYHEHPGEKTSIFCCDKKILRIADALQHIRFHLDPHAFQCKICNMDFSAKNTLEKHMRNAHNGGFEKHKFACDECDKTFELRQILIRHKNGFHSKQV